MGEGVEEPGGTAPSASELLVTPTHVPTYSRTMAMEKWNFFVLSCHFLWSDNNTFITIATENQCNNI